MSSLPPIPSCPKDPTDRPGWLLRLVDPKQLTDELVKLTGYGFWERLSWLTEQPTCRNLWSQAPADDRSHVLVCIICGTPSRIPSDPPPSVVMKNLLEWDASLSPSSSALLQDTDRLLMFTANSKTVPPSLIFGSSHPPTVQRQLNQFLHLAVLEAARERQNMSANPDYEPWALDTLLEIMPPYVQEMCALTPGLDMVSSTVWDAARQRGFLRAAVTQDNQTQTSLPPQTRKM